MSRSNVRYQEAGIQEGLRAVATRNPVRATLMDLELHYGMEDTCVAAVSLAQECVLCPNMVVMCRDSTKNTVAVLASDSV